MKPSSRPTLLQFYLEIGEFQIDRERRTTYFEAPELWKSLSGCGGGLLGLALLCWTKFLLSQATWLLVLNYICSELMDGSTATLKLEYI